MKYQEIKTQIFEDRSVIFKGHLNFQTKFPDISSIEGIYDGIIEINVNFMGISGIEGTLPDNYVEDFLLDGELQIKDGVKNFLDIFNHRMISFFYIISKKYIPSCYSCKTKESLIGKIILSLSSLNSVQKSDNNFIPDQFKISSQDLFWKKNRSAEGLRIIIQNFFNVEVRIEQFIGAFTKGQENLQTTIGNKIKKFNKIGVDFFLGNKTWEQSQGINIHIENLDITQYKKFLPKISKHDSKFSPLEKMKAIIKQYILSDVQITMFFHLNSKSFLELPLNGTRRLGTDTFIDGSHTDTFSVLL